MFSNHARRKNVDIMLEETCHTFWAQKKSLPEFDNLGQVTL